MYTLLPKVSIYYKKLILWPILSTCLSQQSDYVHCEQYNALSYIRRFIAWYWGGLPPHSSHNTDIWWWCIVYSLFIHWLPSHMGHTICVQRSCFVVQTAGERSEAASASVRPLVLSEAPNMYIHICIYFWPCVSKSRKSSTSKALWWRLRPRRCEYDDCAVCVGWYILEAGLMVVVVGSLWNCWLALAGTVRFGNLVEFSVSRGIGRVVSNLISAPNLNPFGARISCLRWVIRNTRRERSHQTHQTHTTSEYKKHEIAEFWKAVWDYFGAVRKD